MKNSPEYKEALDKAIDEKILGKVPVSLFERGYDFAMSQPKHIFDGVAQVGDVRRFEGELVDVVLNTSTCLECVLYTNPYIPYCDLLTNCNTNNVKYIKRV